MDVSGITDRALIRELYGDYALAAARKDSEAWLAAWSLTATWKTPHFEVSGHDALRESWAATWINFTNVAAINEVGAIEVSGDTATVSCCVHEIITMASGGVMKMAGLYTDALAREDGAWRFSRRDYQSLSTEVSPAPQ